MELATRNTDTLVSIVTNPNDENTKLANSLGSAGKWLARLQLFGGNSEECKNGNINIAHWGLVNAKDDIQDLGKEFDFLPLSWRPKAMELGASVITVFDVKDPEFERIQDQAGVQDSRCLFGPEFLVWVPSGHKFASLYFANKTSRRQFQNLRELIGNPVTAKSELIKNKKGSWHGPKFFKCSTPFDLPSDEDVIDESTKFLNPPKVELAPETTRQR